MMCRRVLYCRQQTPAAPGNWNLVILLYPNGSNNCMDSTIRVFLAGLG